MQCTHQSSQLLKGLRQESHLNAEFKASLECNNIARPPSVIENKILCFSLKKKKKKKA
jgi:hypothetical protein